MAAPIFKLVTEYVLLFLNERQSFNNQNTRSFMCAILKEAVGSENSGKQNETRLIITAFNKEGNKYKHFPRNNDFASTIVRVR